MHIPWYIALLYKSEGVQLQSYRALRVSHIYVLVYIYTHTRNSCMYDAREHVWLLRVRNTHTCTSYVRVYIYIGRQAVPASVATRHRRQAWQVSRTGAGPVVSPEALHLHPEVERARSYGGEQPGVGLRARRAGHGSVGGSLPCSDNIRKLPKTLFDQKMR